MQGHPIFCRKSGPTLAYPVMGHCRFIIYFIAITMKIDYLHTYVPQKYDCSERDLVNREIVLQFKRNENVKKVALEVVKWIYTHYYRTMQRFTFMCIPASSDERNIERFQEFSDFVCKMCHMRNGMKYIHIEGERKPQHMWHHFKPVENTYKVSIDKAMGKSLVLMFDDVINTGASARRFKRIIESNGSTVVHGLFLSKVYKPIND